MSSLGAVTVLGVVDADSLGFVLPHEHMTVDNRVHLATGPDYDPDATLSLKTLPQARLAPRSIAENIVLDDDAAVGASLLAYRGAGGGTIVELTPIGMGRDLGRLRAISVATGVNVVAATGYYVERAHRGLVAGRSEEDLAAEFVAELTVPVDGTSRCGVIGEIGISPPPHPDELLVLKAALLAQDATGAPVWIHVTGRRPVPALLDFLEQTGRDLSRVAVSHMDYDLDDLADHERALRLGLYVEFDLFGFPIWNAGNFLHMPTDTRRVQAIMDLADRGYASQLLMSHDVCMKMQLPDWGGFGYAHISSNVLPVFELLGAEPALVGRITRENPRRLLCWAEADARN